MLNNNDLEAAKILMVLPEGTPVIVNGIEGELVFSKYPENFEQLKSRVRAFVLSSDPYYEEDESIEDVIDDAINKHIDTLKSGNYQQQKSSSERPSTALEPSEEDFHTYLRYKDEYEFGVSWVQKEDYNVKPRDLGKPSIPKGTVLVCYQYEAGTYEVCSQK